MNAIAKTSEPIDTTPLPLRSYTIFGVCQGLGEDFGFNPLWLRVPLAATLIFSPLLVIGLYVALGGLVLVSRKLFPAFDTPAQSDSAAASATTVAANSQVEEKLAA